MALTDAQKETLEAHQQALKELQGAVEDLYGAQASLTAAIGPISEIPGLEENLDELIILANDGGQKAAEMVRQVLDSVKNFLGDVFDEPTG